MAKSKMLGVLVPLEDLESLEILADRSNTNRSELVRAALRQVIDGNPIDDLERQRHRKKQDAKRNSELRIGRAGKLLSRRREWDSEPVSPDVFGNLACAAC